MALKKVTGKSQKRSRTFTDLSLGMVRNANTQDVAVVKNDNAIKQAVKNLIMTTPGEKPFQPLVGSNVSQLLFEPMDDFTGDAIKQEIINTIQSFEPRVRLSDVSVRSDFSRNTFNVTVSYKIVGVPVKETIEFVLQRPE